MYDFYIPAPNISLIAPNKTIRVVSILDTPFLRNKTSTDGKHFQGNDRFEGFCADLASKVFKMLGLQYEFHLVRDGLYGREINGTWNGMVGEILDGVRRSNRLSLSITFSLVFFSDCRRSNSCTNYQFFSRTSSVIHEAISSNWHFHHDQKTRKTEARRFLIYGPLIYFHLDVYHLCLRRCFPCIILGLPILSLRMAKYGLCTTGHPTKHNVGSKYTFNLRHGRLTLISFINVI